METGGFRTDVPYTGAFRRRPDGFHIIKSPSCANTE